MLRGSLLRDPGLWDKLDLRVVFTSSVLVLLVIVLLQNQWEDTRSSTDTL